MPPFALTQFARAGGCAAKISQADLRQALASLPVFHDPGILVGHSSEDDAAVVRLSDDLALVETVDIFPPVVDDAFDFGRIAAANALSDIYAMGARPLNALSFVAWPVEKLGLEPLKRLFEGAAAICAEAGIAISGGHSIVDEEPKFGLFVTGLCHPGKIVTNAGLRPGDCLVLTKAIGTGILTTALKRGHLAPAELVPAIRSMTTLNRAAAAAMIACDAHAATDVTGFGLLGHLGNMLRASSKASGAALGATLSFERIPLLPNVHACLADGLCPAGTRRNLDYAAPLVDFDPALSEAERLVLADAQTSGGLIIAVAQDSLQRLLDTLTSHGVEIRAAIGSVIAADRVGAITVSR